MAHVFMFIFSDLRSRFLGWAPNKFSGVILFSCVSAQVGAKLADNPEL